MMVMTGGGLPGFCLLCLGDTLLRSFSPVCVLSNRCRMIYTLLENVYIPYRVRPE